VRALARLKVAGFVVVSEVDGLETDYEALREWDWSQRQPYGFEQRHTERKA